MKTLTRDGKFKRVQDTTQEQQNNIKMLVRWGWEFCGKELWKKATRKPKEVKKDKKKGKEKK